MKVAIVLGHRMNDDGSVPELMLKRVAMTCRMIQEWNPDRVILSGGAPNKKASVAEADVMHRLLVEAGVDPALLVVENGSKTTKMNAELAVPMAAEMGADTIILLTSNEHLYRKYFNPVKFFWKEMLPYQMNLITYKEPTN